jgi:hypothetical protein
MGSRSPSESTRLRAATRPKASPKRPNGPRGSSHEVRSPSASPRTQQQHEWTGLPTPDRLRPQVFSTSRRLHPPRACRPCLMPDPLMGLRPSELCSPRQAVRRLRRLAALLTLEEPGRRPEACASGGAEALLSTQAMLSPTHEHRSRRTTSRAALEDPENLLVFRALLLARIRHCEPAV